MNGSESGRGQPHSKTLRKNWHAISRGSVLECGCPLPLLLLQFAGAPTFIALMLLELGVLIFLTSGRYIGMK